MYPVAAPLYDLMTSIGNAEGLKAQTYDRQLGSGVSLAVGGTAYGCAIPILKPAAITTVWSWVTTAGAAITHAQLGIYNQALTIRYGTTGDTAGDRTAFQTAQAVGCLLTTPLVLAAGLYYIIAVWTGTTLPTMSRSAGATNTPFQIGSNSFPFFTGGTGLTAVPNVPVTPSSANVPFGLWFGVS